MESHSPTQTYFQIYSKTFLKKFILPNLKINKKNYKNLPSQIK